MIQGRPQGYYSLDDIENVGRMSGYDSVWLEEFEERVLRVHENQSHKNPSWLKVGVGSQVRAIRAGQAETAFLFGLSQMQLVPWSKTLEGTVERPLGLKGVAIDGHIGDAFAGMQCRHVDFSHAKMRGLNWHGASFEDCNLFRADLGSVMVDKQTAFTADLSEVKFVNCRLVKTWIRHAVAPNLVISGGNATELNLEGTYALGGELAPETAENIGVRGLALHGGRTNLDFVRRIRDALDRKEVA